MLEKTINNAICALLFRCEQQSVKEMDKIHAMQLFIKVAELESFSRAADFFALPKGSVSRQIQALEHQLGTQLLQRTTRRVKLTPEGMTYYQRAKVLSTFQLKVCPSNGLQPHLLKTLSAVTSHGVSGRTSTRSAR